MRTNCTGCGATVELARIEGSRERVALEINPETGADAQRYRVVRLNPLVVSRVPKDAPGTFQPDHAFDCPAHNAGR
jgi:lysine biosynthesis protein LysW